MRFDKEIYQTYRKIHNLLTITENGSRILNPEYREFDGVYAEVASALDQMSAPLRVAVAGYMKAGKSTLLNAIMQKKMLCTGALITTYTPTWFKYGAKESLELVFKDGTHQTEIPLEDLEKWTSIKRRDENPQMDDVLYVIIYCPNEILKEIELIDTPGLFSPEEKDSERTIRLLGLNGISDANKLNQQQVSMADAIIYAFSSNFKECDLSAVKSFTSTPINAIAVFTKIEQSYWDIISGDPEVSPMQRMQGTIERCTRELKNEIYCILPVVSIIVEGFVSLTDNDWRALCSIAQEPMESVTRALFSASFFVKTPLGETTGEERGRLYQILDKYGIYCIAKAIQDGMDRDSMLDHLYQVSGIEVIVDKMKSHFGMRSFSIKTEATLSRIENRLQKIRFSQGASRSSQMMGLQIEQQIAEVRKSRAFAQLQLLRTFYEEKLRFPTEEDNESFLKLMGENGNGTAARLGLEEQVTMEELYCVVKKLHDRWSFLANDFTLEREVCAAAQVVLDSVSELRYHIEMLVAF